MKKEDVNERDYIYLRIWCNYIYTHVILAATLENLDILPIRSTVWAHPGNREA
jgi:hypothetical protein